MLQKIGETVKELNKLLPQFEKLLVNLISILGWIIILTNLLK